MQILDLFIGTVLLVIVIILGKFIARKIKKRRRKQELKFSRWSIGYQTSKSPNAIDPETAFVYSKEQMPPETVGAADPFLLEHESKIYLFYELILRASPASKIAVSVYDDATQGWTFQSIVLDEPFHLSYPYVFKHGSEIYMIPESKEAKSVRLYRSVDFPLKWQFERTLIDNQKFVDSSIIFWKNCFYLFASRKRKLYLFYSNALNCDWHPHPKAPVKRGNYARCAGRIFEHNGRLFRFAQEQAKGYGMGVRRYEILTLSAEDYKEVAIDKDLFLRPFGYSWAKHGMHHIDTLKCADNNYLSVFDGRGISNRSSAPSSRDTVESND